MVAIQELGCSRAWSKACCQLRVPKTAVYWLPESTARRKLIAPPAVSMVKPAALLLAMIRLPLTSTAPPVVPMVMPLAPPTNKSPPLKPLTSAPPNVTLPPPVDRLASKITMPPPSRSGLVPAVDALVLLSASMTKFNLPLPPVLAMAWLITIELAARKVSVTSLLPEDLVMPVLTVKSPRSLPVEEVVTVTLVPPLSKPSIELAAMEVPLFCAEAPPKLPMVTLVGSNNHSPALPCGAAADPLTPSVTSKPPEVSIRPPSPPCSPPLAKIVPCTVVTDSAFLMSLHNTTVPPWPLSVALASMVAVASMVTVVACWPGWPVACSKGSAVPCQLPPTSTVPPPWLPVASIRLPACNETCSPCKLTLPPWPCALLTFSVPLFSVLVLPDSTMRPPCCCKPVASITPLFLTTPPTSRSIDWALMMTKPPGACTACWLSTKAWIWLGATRKLVRRLLLSKLRSTASPEAIATVPMCAITAPWLRTSGASRAMYPPKAALSSPSLTTLPVLPLRS